MPLLGLVTIFFVRLQSYRVPDSKKILLAYICMAHVTRMLICICQEDLCMPTLVYPAYPASLRFRVWALNQTGIVPLQQREWVDIAPGRHVRHPGKQDGTFVLFINGMQAINRPDIFIATHLSRKDVEIKNQVINITNTTANTR
ncbi:hypothetical protein BD769DRAFT_1394089 [Suillus cothurnatus]|nr:hypothetical protein BD769DRAFT_1394089 [Suillus cothurnatus]